MSKYQLKIKEYRKLEGLTQKELARRVGISRSYLSEIENGKYDISLSLLVKIGDILNLNLNTLAGYDCCENCPVFYKR